MSSTTIYDTALLARMIEIKLILDVVELLVIVGIAAMLGFVLYELKRNRK